jgi:hypothetical protein
LLGEEIGDIVACDGAERHERLHRWARRMEGAGFGRVPLSYYALLQARRAVQGLPCDGFNVRDDNHGCFFPSSPSPHGEAAGSTLISFRISAAVLLSMCCIGCSYGNFRSA